MIALQAGFCVAQSSVLKSGNWYKLGVETRGVYKITFDQFKQMGFNPGSTDPVKIRIYGNEGGMLPQANNAARPIDLREIAILIPGDTDGSFDKDDYILFFAEGPDKVRYDVGKNIFSYQSNLYSEKNYYYITVSEDAGKRLPTVENISGNYTQVASFEDYVYHEADEHNELKSGREWFGERYDATSTYAYNFDIGGIIDNSTLTLVSDVMAQSFNGSSFKVSFNRSLVGEQVVPVILNSQYTPKGNHDRDTLSFNAATVGAPGNVKQEILYEYIKSASGKNVGYLDFMLLNFSRKLSLYGDQTLFRSTASLEQEISTYTIENVPDNSSVWDVTDPSSVKQQVVQHTGNTVTFTASGEILKEFIVFNANIKSPELVSAVANQDLHGAAPANLIIVSHPSFLAEAERLAAHRQVHNNWSSIVVTPEMIYNEYSSGRQDVTAIRDFVKSMYDKDPGSLRSLLIMGKGSYDYKDRVTNNTNFVPTYESRNSLAPLRTYSSDDYFAFLEGHEGNWGESPLQNHTLDIGVGRFR